MHFMTQTRTQNLKAEKTSRSFTNMQQKSISRVIISRALRLFRDLDIMTKV